MKKSQTAKVMDSLKQMISEGKYSAGNRLPTENELAELLFVSRGTVRSGLRELVNEKILEQRHGVGCFVSANSDHLPSAGSGKGRVALIASSTQGGFNNHLLEGIESLLFQHGVELLFYNIANVPEKINSIIDRVVRGKYLGVIFAPVITPNYYEINGCILDRFDLAGINYVVVDSPVAKNGIIRSNFVGSDGYTAEREIVRNLIENGHSRIGSIRVFSSVYTADQRFSGISDELSLRKLSLAPELHNVIEDVPLFEQGRHRVRDMIALPDPPTAIICSHDFIAMNVIDELKKLHLRVPEDISIWGFDDEAISNMLHLSTVRQPFRAIGARAVEILLENKTQGRRQEFLPCQLIERETVSKNIKIKEGVLA